ncbi:hypothetical protein EV426DRAFT_601098 [Tirmania nivea]|nr:hypothetical protein EV426DRAFT_601098 [Tirmania nivea]
MKSPPDCPRQLLTPLRILPYLLPLPPFTIRYPRTAQQVYGILCYPLLAQSAQRIFHPAHFMQPPALRSAGSIQEPFGNIPFPDTVFEPATIALSAEQTEAVERLSTQLRQVHRGATQAFLNNEDEAGWAATIREIFATIHASSGEENFFELKETKSKRVYEKYLPECVSTSHKTVDFMITCDHTHPDIASYIDGLGSCYNPLNHPAASSDPLFVLIEGKHAGGNLLKARYQLALIATSCVNL